MKAISMSQATKSTTLIPSRRALLAGAAAAALAAGGAVNILATATATATARPSSIDPIFAVIAEHRDAQEACAVACAANGLDVEDDPNKEAAMTRAGAAELPLLTTAPITVAGVVALLEYVHSPCHEIWQGMHNHPDTVLSYARGFQHRDMQEAVGGFDAHILAALRNIAGRAQS